MGSEVDKWLRSGMVKASQIVSVDCDASVVEATKRNKAGVKVRLGYLEEVVEALVKEKVSVAVVNADYMDTHMTIYNSAARILEATSKQKCKTLVIINGNSLVRYAKDEELMGKGNVMTGLLSHLAFRRQVRRSEHNRALWDEMSFTLNTPRQQTGLSYVSNRAPMQTTFLVKRPNPEYVSDFATPTALLEVKPSKRSNGDTTNYSIGATKAWITRRERFGKTGHA